MFLRTAPHLRGTGSLNHGHELSVGLAKGPEHLVLDALEDPEQGRSETEGRGSEQDVLHRRRLCR